MARPAHATKPGLFLSRTMGWRNAGFFSTASQPKMWYGVGTWAQPRRDRRRDLDDNDMRNIEGIPASLYAGNMQRTMRGDSQALDSLEVPAFSPALQVEDFALAWVDRQGWTT